MACRRTSRQRVRGREFQEAERELCELVDNQRAAILQAARIDNVNLRGNAIEQLLTGAANRARTRRLGIDP
jgi:hypothetical protein